MARVLMDPPVVRPVADRLLGMAEALRATETKSLQVLHGLHWEARQRSGVDEQAAAAVAAARTLADQARDLGNYALRKVEAFVAADRAGAAGFGRTPEPAAAVGVGVAAVSAAGAGAAAGAATAAAAHAGAATRWPAPPPAPPGAEYPPSPDQVRFMQDLWGIREDGYGPETQARVREIQERIGVQPDPAHQIGPRTWQAIVNTWQAEKYGTAAVDGWDRDHGYRTLVAIPPGLRLQSPLDPEHTWYETSGFGPRDIGSGFHKGWDLAGPAAGTARILAPISGEALTVENDGDFGHYVLIRSDSGVEVLLAHLHQPDGDTSPFLIKEGTVEAGTPVGYVGRTGFTENARGERGGPGAEHLHLEVRVPDALGRQVAMDAAALFGWYGVALTG